MRILVLEDSKPIKELFKRRFEKEGHSVDIVDNGHQGFILASSHTYDVVVSDIQMPHWDGLKFVEAMQVVCPRTPIIIVTASSVDDALRGWVARYKNIIEVFSKPLDFKAFFMLLDQVIVQEYDNVNKKARIVCTLGPSSQSREILGKMVLAGMDVARLNFSHGSYEQHEATLRAVREAETEWGKPIAVLQDLCGPKIRTGPMQNGSVILKAGERITVQADAVVGTSERISVSIPGIIADLQKGDPILLDDGLLELRVMKMGNGDAQCEVISGGVLKSNKGMNLPATTLSLPSVTEKDWRDLVWGLAHPVDYVALSFVRSPDEILRVKEYIRKANKRHLRVVAKIEKPEAVKHIREIIEVADGIMIARGDMGVELPAARVPRIQQEINRLCWESNKPVITATQMLDSMTSNARPTRAEVTDVSMAIREGTDAVMLSQETATGVDPVNVVRTMASIVREEEQYTRLSGEQYQQLMNDKSANPALTAVAGLTNTAAVLLLDMEGLLYPLLSKWNRKIPSLLITGSAEVARQASLYYNIVPMIIYEKLDHDEMIAKVMDTAKEWGYIRAGDRVAVVEGSRVTAGGLNQIGSLQLVAVV